MCCGNMPSDCSVLREEAQLSVRELRDLQRGRVLIGSNEAGVHVLLPLIENFREKHSRILVDVGRVPARQVGVEVAQGSLDFGVVTFDPGDKRLQSVTAWLGRARDARLSVACLRRPRDRADGGVCARDGHRAQRSVACARSGAAAGGASACADQHSDRAAEPRRDQEGRGEEDGRGAAAAAMCALRRSSVRQLVAVKIPEVRYPRQLRLIYRRGELSHAATAFLRAASKPADVGQVPGHLPDLIEIVEEQARSRPMCPRVNASRAPAGIDA